MKILELASVLAAVLVLQAYPDAICRFPQKLGFTFKSKEDQTTIWKIFLLMNTLIAIERCLVRVRK